MAKLWHFDRLKMVEVQKFCTIAPDSPQDVGKPISIESIEEMPTYVTILKDLAQAGNFIFSFEEAVAWKNLKMRRKHEALASILPWSTCIHTSLCEDFLTWKALASDSVMRSCRLDCLYFPWKKTNTW